MTACISCIDKRDHAHKHAKERGVTQFERIWPIALFIKAGWRCQACGEATPRELMSTCDPRAPELDHILAISKGGQHVLANVQLLCRACNTAKGLGERNPRGHRARAANQNATGHAAGPRKRHPRRGGGASASAAIISLTGGCLFFALPHNFALGVENHQGVGALEASASIFGTAKSAKNDEKHATKHAENAPKVQESVGFPMKSAPIPLNSGGKRDRFEGQA